MSQPDIVICDPLMDAWGIIANALDGTEERR